MTHLTEVVRDVRALRRRLREAAPPRRRQEPVEARQSPAKAGVAQKSGKGAAPATEAPGGPGGRFLRKQDIMDAAAGGQQPGAAAAAEAAGAPAEGAGPGVADLLQMLAKALPEDRGRRFELNRKADKSGVSGTGIVAEGIAFRDGTCVVRWLTDTATTTTFDSIEDVEAVHGHDGATQVHWIDQ